MSRNVQDMENIKCVFSGCCSVAACDKSRAVVVGCVCFGRGVSLCVCVCSAVSQTEGSW